MKTFCNRVWGSRKMRVVCYIRDPKRAATGPNATGQADSRRKSQRIRSRLEVARGSQGSSPDLQASKRADVGVKGPHASKFPTPGFAYRPKHSGHALAERRRFSQNLANRQVAC